MIWTLGIVGYVLVGIANATLVGPRVFGAGQKDDATAWAMLALGWPVTIILMILGAIGGIAMTLAKVRHRPEPPDPACGPVVFRAREDESA